MHVIVTVCMLEAACTTQKGEVGHQWPWIGSSSCGCSLDGSRGLAANLMLGYLAQQATLAQQQGASLQLRDCAHVLR